MHSAISFFLRLAVITLALSAGNIASGWAEDSEADRGRLPDGRAFRTDAEGNQLVDYLAELELSVETLERQVGALQTELEQKQQIIDRAGIKSAQGSSITERTLVGKESAPAAAVVPAVSAETCAPYVQSCSGDLRTVSQQLEEAQTDLAIAKQEQRQRGETENQALERVRAQLESREQALAEQEGLIGKRKEELESLAARLKDQEQEIVQLAERSREEEERAAERLTEMRAKLEKSFEAGPYENSQAPALGSSQGNQRLANAKLRALDSIRGTLTTEYNQLRGMIAKRDQAYKRINFSGRSVKFGLTPLVSSRGRRVNDFPSAIASAKNARELSFLRSELAELRTKIKDDMTVMERMR